MGVQNYNTFHIHMSPRVHIRPVPWADSYVCFFLPESRLPGLNILSRHSTIEPNTKHISTLIDLSDRRELSFIRYPADIQHWTIWGPPLKIKILKSGFLHAREDQKIGPEPKFHVPRYSNGKDSDGKPKRGQFLTLDHMGNPP